MSATISKWSGYDTPITLIAGTSLNGSSVTSGAWATSGSTFLDNGTNRDQLCDIWLSLPSAVTAGSGTPRVDVFFVPVPNGTDAPTPPGTSAGATPGHYFRGSILANPSASFTSGSLSGVILPPGKFIVLIQNNLGVAFPSSDGAVFAAYPYADQGEAA